MPIEHPNFYLELPGRETDSCVTCPMYFHCTSTNYSLHNEHAYITIKNLVPTCGKCIGCGKFITADQNNIIYTFNHVNTVITRFGVCNTLAKYIDRIVEDLKIEKKGRNLFVGTFSECSMFTNIIRVKGQTLCRTV